MGKETDGMIVVGKARDEGVDDVMIDSRVATALANYRESCGVATYDYMKALSMNNGDHDIAEAMCSVADITPVIESMMKCSGHGPVLSLGARVLIWMETDNSEEGG